MTQYQFLSDEWLDETRKLRAEFQDRAPQVAVTVRMNQVISEVPFGEGVIRAHVDTSSGTPEIDVGHLEAPDLTVTMSYATAKAILIDGDAATAMNAFLGGRIKVDGDITKLIAMQNAGTGTAANREAAELVKRIQAITA